jgi:hypothetical protein
MKKIALPLLGMVLGNLAGAAEKLTIAPAHALPDYTKLTAAIGTSDRLFVTGFAAGDFNEDGQMDIVVQTGGSFAFPFHPFGAQTFLGQTNGTFTRGAERLLPNIGLTWDFVPGDFNEDGHLDILMEDADNDMVLTLGNGDGTFQPGQFLGLSAAGYFAVANLDGNKHLDIVAGNLDGTVGVFSGAGDGTFSRGAILDTQIQASHPRFGEILIGDLNGDQALDVVVASGEMDNLDVFLGNNDGTFQPRIRLPGVPVGRGALGDFNGDGKLDYAGNMGRSPERLEIWFGSGDGRFSRGPRYSMEGVYGLAYGVKSGDLNADGILDIVVAGQRTIPAAPMSIFLGNGNGTFRPRIPFTQANGNLPINTGGQLIDFNGDGFLDILTLSWLGTDPATELEAMSIALSNGAKRDPRLGALLTLERSADSTNAPVILEASTDLSTWTPLATNLSAATPWPITDSTTSLRQRFYRTRVP